MSEKHCIHYSSFGGMKCALGIDIERNFRPRAPCWTGNSPPESSAKCPQFMAPTPEQLAEQERRADASFERFGRALPVVMRWLDEQTKPHVAPMAGEIQCPCCSTSLRIRVDTFHVYAQCQTPDCVVFRGSRRR